MSLNRRDFIQNVAMAAGVLGAGGSVSFAAMAADSATRAPKVAVQQQKRAAPNTQVPGVYNTKVGAIEITAILDGGMEFSADLFTTAPQEQLETQQKAMFQSAGPIKGYLNTFIIRNGSKTILVDTGGGAAMGESVGKLQQNLAASGLNYNDINEIYLTHGHIDHVSGLVDAAGKALFTQAQIHVSEQELAFWYSDEMREKMPEAKKGLFAAARKALDPYIAEKRVETFKPSADLGGGITVVDLPGHTPGHSGFRISQGREQLLIWGDIVHAPMLQFAHPDWSIAFDTDAAKALETRNKILAEVTSDRVRIAGMHHVFPAFGHVAKATAGYAFVPQNWEV